MSEEKSTREKVFEFIVYLILILSVTLISMAVSGWIDRQYEDWISYFNYVWETVLKLIIIFGGIFVFFCIIWIITVYYKRWEKKWEEKRKRKFNRIMRGIPDETRYIKILKFSIRKPLDTIYIVSEEEFREGDTVIAIDPHCLIGGYSSPYMLDQPCKCKIIEPDAILLVGWFKKSAFRKVVMTLPPSHLKRKINQ